MGFAIFAPEQNRSLSPTHRLARKARVGGALSSVKQMVDRISSCKCEAELCHIANSRPALKNKKKELRDQLSLTPARRATIDRPVAASVIFVLGDARLKDL